MSRALPELVVDGGSIVVDGCDNTEVEADAGKGTEVEVEVEVLEIGTKDVVEPVGPTCVDEIRTLVVGPTGWDDAITGTASNAPTHDNIETNTSPGRTISLLFEAPPWHRLETVVHGFTNSGKQPGTIGDAGLQDLCCEEDRRTNLVAGMRSHLGHHFPIAEMMSSV